MVKMIPPSIIQSGVIAYESESAQTTQCMNCESQN